MGEEYITYTDSILVGLAYFTKNMEDKLPKDRIIDIYYNDLYKEWFWKTNEREYSISGDMIKKEIKDTKYTNMTADELMELLTLLYNKTQLLSEDDLDKALKLITNLKKTNKTLFDKVLELEDRLEDVKTVFGIEFSY